MVLVDRTFGDLEYQHGMGEDWRLVVCALKEDTNVVDSFAVGANNAKDPILSLYQSRNTR